MLRWIIKILLFPISLLLSILIAFMTFLLNIGTVLLYFLMILCVVGAIVSFIQNKTILGSSVLYVSRLINKKEGIINKVFVDMLDKLGYDIQLVYVKKKGAAENEQRKTQCIYGCDIGDYHDNIGAGT